MIVDDKVLTVVKNRILQSYAVIIKMMNKKKTKPQILESNWEKQHEHDFVRFKTDLLVKVSRKEL